METEERHRNGYTETERQIQRKTQRYRNIYKNRETETRYKDTDKKGGKEIERHRQKKETKR